MIAKLQNYLKRIFFKRRPLAGETWTRNIDNPWRTDSDEIVIIEVKNGWVRSSSGNSYGTLKRPLPDIVREHKMHTFLLVFNFLKEAELKGE